jgi:hypothetical protein
MALAVVILICSFLFFRWMNEKRSLLYDKNKKQQMKRQTSDVKPFKFSKYTGLCVTFYLLRITIK